MATMTAAPQRAQRVRGIPGVGLRTPGGTEWSAIPGHPGKYRLARYRGEVWNEFSDHIDVRSCTRPGKYGNPWRTARRGDRWVVEWSSYESFMRYPTEQAATECVLLTFRSRVMMWPDEYFEDLARYDYLSCWCPLDGPCHVDEILAEGRRRGVWQ